jgi:hypothetical protein
MAHSPLPSCRSVERINLYYDNLQFRLDMQRGGIGYLFEQPQLFWSVTIFIFHVALFLVATLFVAMGWAVTLSIGIAANAWATGHSPLEMILQAVLFRSSQRTGLISLALILGVNALFGAVTQIATTHRWHREPRYS